MHQQLSAGRPAAMAHWLAWPHNGQVPVDGSGGGRGMGGEPNNNVGGVSVGPWPGGREGAEYGARYNGNKML
jgi:hypothetical protein